MDSFVERVRTVIREHELLRERERVLVGISGGADSIVLAHVLQTLGFSIHAVHVNYRLRGEASEGDETFVRSWCDRRNVDLRVESFDTARITDERGLSVQEAAREMRYDTFASVAQASGIRTAAVGHHRDDQAETVLLNLFRGTGPEGLAGMPIKREILTGSGIQLVRPLLFCSREEIEAYAERRGEDWRRDATNVKTIYRRGALRGEIFPLIERHFGPSVRRNVARSAELMRAYVDASLNGELRHAFEQAREPADTGGGALRLDVLQSLPEVVRRRIIIEGFRRWMPDVEATARTAEEIERLMASQPGRRHAYGGGEVWRERDRLLFVTSTAGDDDPPETMLRKNAAAVLSIGTVRADELREPPSSFEPDDPNVAFVDARAITFPLCIRTWRAGDRFSPLGMTHTKKLSDFLTDEQVRPHRKRDALVVASNDRIVWVIGHRIAHDVRVTSETTTTIRFRFEESRKTLT